MPRRNNRDKSKNKIQHYNERRLKALKKEILKNQALKDADLEATKKDRE